MTDEQFVELVDNLSSRLARKFTFGYHTYEDIKQQAFIEAWKGLDSYDGKRPLENFLWVHVKNRLCNFKRDNFERLDKPCLKCPLYNKTLQSECAKFENKNLCEEYCAWVARNSPKKNLVNCLDIDNIDDEKESRTSVSTNYVENIEQKRILNLLDQHIPLHLRASYIKMRAGSKVSKRDRDEIKKIIAELMEANASE